MEFLFLEKYLKMQQAFCTNSLHSMVVSSTPDLIQGTRSISQSNFLSSKKKCYQQCRQVQNPWMCFSDILHSHSKLCLSFRYVKLKVIQHSPILSIRSSQQDSHLYQSQASMKKYHKLEGLNHRYYYLLLLESRSSRPRWLSLI